MVISLAALKAAQLALAAVGVLLDIALGPAESVDRPNTDPVLRPVIVYAIADVDARTIAAIAAEIEHRPGQVG